MSTKSSGVSGGREWIAAEKVHGAHFAVVCDDSGVHPAKRREPLSMDALDGFFGVSRIWPGLSVAAARFASVLRRDHGEAAVVTAYGELAGGRYPHPEVPAAPGVEPVQTGVWYAPGLHWLLFDASVDTPQGRFWVSDRCLRDTAAIASLPCVPAVAYGAPQRLRELACDFPTMVPAGFGLPELTGNLAEGYVLKPAGQWQETGGTGAGERPMIKVKQKGFAEDARFDGSRPYLPPPEGAAGVPAWLLVEATALLTPARAAAAVSKIGSGAGEDTVAAEIAGDVCDELSEALGGLDDTLTRDLAGALADGARILAAFDAADRRSAS